MSSDLTPERPSEPSEDTGSQSFGFQTIFIALRRWWVVATPIAMLLAVGAAVGVAFLVKPKYTATAWIQIRARPEHVLGAVAAEDPQKFVQNQLELLRSPLVLSGLANEPEIARIPEIAAETDAYQALRKLLKIHAQGKSEYYVLEFTSVDAERAALVVNRVAKTYLDRQRREESERLSRTILALRGQKEQQEGVVKTYRSEVSQLSKELTGIDPFGAKAKERQPEARNPAADLKAQLVTCEVDHLFLKAEVEAETELLDKQEVEIPKSEVNQYIQDNPQVTALATRIEINHAKVNAYLQSSADLPKNAQYQRINQQLSDDEAALAKLKIELEKDAHALLEKKIRMARRETIAAMQRKVTRSEATLNFLHDKLKAEISNQKEYQGDLLVIEFKRADYERAAQVHDQMAARITALSLEQLAPDRVEIAKPAVVPVNPDESLPYKKMAFAALGAFCLPFGCAVAVEGLFRRVSSRSQLESCGNMLVVGEITTLPRRSRASKLRGQGNRELQLFEESVEGLWMYLKLSESVKSIAVTSAISGEGKTSLATQLAISIAGATGSRTLLIDGDMRSPDVHRLLGIDCSPGLVDVLRGDAELQDAVETEFSDHLHVLTAGRNKGSPTRLLQGDAFPRLMEKLKVAYDYIVIDTPPILAANEALLMARTADAAILCARRDYSCVSQIQDAQWKLKAAKVKYAGTVLSGIPMNSYVQRYGAYYGDEHPEAGSQT